MKSSATTIDEYLAEIPADRREDIKTIRASILNVLPIGYEEVIAWGMITYQVPLSIYPDTYNKHPLAMAALANQKNHMAIYLMGTYGDTHQEGWLADEFAKAGKKLDMGKSCVRFKKLDDIVLEPILEIIKNTDMMTYVNTAKQAHSVK